jgi:cytochrome c biogenesis protein CcmG, thiol:disulfide interchange protein DsbE
LLAGLHMVEDSHTPKRVRQSLILILALLALVAAGPIVILKSTVGEHKQPDVGPEKGQTAPEFSARTPDGEIVHLSDFNGRIVLLNFFATWCGPCKAEASHLKAAYERSDGNIVFLGVTFQDTAASVRAFASDYYLPFPLVLDDSGDAGRDYRVLGLPTTFFIRADGIVHYVVKGPMTKELIEIILEGIPE